MIEWRERKGEKLAPELIEKYQLSPITAKLLSLRGINTDAKLAFWFNATEDDLAAPYLMHDMQKAVTRINQAIDAGEKITIYGDYDADGITATSIMMETLGILGADVHFFIPDRFKDGYGPNLDVYKKIAADGTKLIITVDNGVTGVEEVDYAKSMGVDTIITDHHKFQDKVPESYALVHCNYPGQKYPFDDYCGAGVAYTISRALMQDSMPELLELAMIGTIGDMVKVSGEGHILVKRGLKMLNETERPGLRALIKKAGLQMGHIDETDVGFNIAPRLNAVGRLDNASLAVDLLLCETDDEAEKIADKIEELNDKRKNLTSKVYNSCLNQIKNNGWERKKTLVLYNPKFHEGVLGLVANKLVEKTHKPTIVLTKNDKGIIKGSGRSVDGFNLFNALEPLKDKLFLKFGGHDFACGLSMTEDKITSLRATFEKSFKGIYNQNIRYYDCELPFSNLDLKIITDIKKAGPFGSDNVAPVFSILHPTINSCFYMGKEKNHIKLNIRKNNKNIDVVGFNKKYLTKILLPYVDQIFIQLQENCYRNQVKLQGIIKGIIFAAPKLVVPAPVIDLRDEKYIMGFADRYLIFDKRNKNIASSLYDIDPAKITLVNDYNNEGEVAAFLDVPRNQQELNLALTYNYEQLYLRFIMDQLPVKRLPPKVDFVRLLKYVYSHPGLAVADYRTVGLFLQIAYDNILFILRVFFELKFIKLEDDRIFGVANPIKRKLTDSNYFRATNSQIKFITDLRQMPSQKLLMYVNEQLKQH